MNNKLKKSEFARAFQQSNAWVKVNINRGKLIVGRDDLIDIEHPQNKLFIQYKIASGKKFDLNKIYQVVHEPKIKKTKKTNDDITEPIKSNKNDSYSEKDNILNLAEKKMQFEVTKLRLDCELKELQKAKIEGSLIPVDAVREIFLWSIDTFHNSYHQEVQSIAQIMKNGVSYEVTLKNIHKALLKLKEDAKNNLVAGVAGIVNEYQEVRGRGEKK